ncbi:hypothetical protein [Fodinicola feengrottensis]|uniref:Uncharacterized protein n=1 Tax=Fodinicola feengrottensis TaxID=435914 RepID=A0ABN2I6P2_9ACTN|nr:hypothetical protein [Fodinicola feengrottensis]
MTTNDDGYAGLTDPDTTGIGRGISIPTARPQQPTSPYEPPGGFPPLPSDSSDQSRGRGAGDGVESQNPLHSGQRSSPYGSRGYANDPSGAGGPGDISPSPDGGGGPPPSGSGSGANSGGSGGSGVQFDPDGIAQHGDDLVNQLGPLLEQAKAGLEKAELGSEDFSIDGVLLSSCYPGAHEYWLKEVDWIVEELGKLQGALHQVAQSWSSAEDHSTVRTR